MKTGTEIISPTIPANLKPIESARRVIIGLTPVERCVILGTKT
jgi:hypothetical protein